MIKFSMLSLSARDQNETVLINTLLNSNPEYHKINKPIAFPICGAGRAFPPLIGSAINAENINMICTFLTGKCSCEIKEQNPGFDLPITADWSCIESDQLYTENVLPPLTGVIPEAAVNNQDETTSEDNPDAAGTNNPAQLIQSSVQEPGSAKRSSLLSLTIIITILLTALAATITSVMLKLKQ
jgi:hypothetical protein